MSIVSAITRGFGFRIGSNFANSLMEPKQKVTNNVATIDELECWSHKGYAEGEVEIIKDINWRSKRQKWYMWPVHIFNGCFFITPLFYIKDTYNIFFKNYYLHFYDFKWNTYKVSDRRAKTGIREVKNLDMIHSKSVIDTPPLRNKIETIIVFVLVCWLPIFLLIFNLTK